jgi:hypothetical protein
MSTTPERLMTRSLLEVFNERDSHRRAATMGEIYSPGCPSASPSSTTTWAGRSGPLGHRVVLRSYSGPTSHE